MTFITNDRIQVIHGVPPALPHACIICDTSSNDRDYIDFNYSIPDHGAVYFCNVCMRVALKLLGWAPPEDIKFLEDAKIKAELKAELARIEVNNELYLLLDRGGFFDGVLGLRGTDTVEALTVNSEAESNTNKSPGQRRPANVRKSTLPDL
jgi:hypothetical protein